MITGGIVQGRGMQTKVKVTHFISNNGGVSEHIDIFTKHRNQTLGERRSHSNS